MDYLYDENGMLYGFFYNGAKYFYIRDTMQNILGIIDASGDCVVQYNYSAYGECVSVTGDMAGTVGKANSFRYKGYYFDRETGFFYCKSRYYLPEWKRWLNSDDPSFLELYSINNLNLYGYCSEDSINKYDPNGFSWKSFWQSVGDFFCNTFGAFVDLSKDLKKDSYDYIYVGYETGSYMSGSKGDDSKPISVFVTNAKEWWRITEYQAGIQMKIGKFSASLSLGIGEPNLSVGIGDVTVKLQCGIGKTGIGFYKTVDNATIYSEIYYRQLPLLITVLGVIFCPQFVPVAAAAAFAL